MISFELWKNEDMGMPDAVINTDSYTDALEKVLYNLDYYIIELYNKLNREPFI